MMVIAKLMKALNKAQFDGGWDYIPKTKGDNDE